MKEGESFLSLNFQMCVSSHGFMNAGDRDKHHTVFSEVFAQLSEHVANNILQ